MNESVKKALKTLLTTILSALVAFATTVITNGGFN